MSDALERFQHQRRVPQPAVAIVPVARPPDDLRERRRGRGHHRTRGFVGEQFERDRRTAHFVGPQRSDARAAGPRFPLLARRFHHLRHVGHRRRVQLLVIRQQQEMLAVQLHRLFGFDPLEWEARERNRSSSPFTAIIMRGVRTTRAPPGSPGAVSNETRIEGRPQRLTQNRGRSGGALALAIARHEIDDFECVGVGAEFGAQNRGPGYVRLARGGLVPRAHAERPRVRIEKGAEDRRAVEARQAAPVDASALVHERSGGRVTDDPVAHAWQTSVSR